MGKKQLRALIVATLSLLLPGCAKHEDAAPKQQARDTLGKKEEYRKKVEAELRELDRTVDDLKAKVQKSSPRIRSELKKEIAELEEKRDVAARKLDELKPAAAAAWEDAKAGVEAAMDDLKQAYQKVVSDFNRTRK